MVVFRSVLKAPISRLFPISLGSETVFGVLFTVLVITTMINFFRRIRINRSIRSERPIWHGIGGEEV